MPTLASINQSTHENSSPLEIIQQLLQQCTLTERLQASAIASLSVGEAAAALKQELLRPKKISLELSSQGLIGIEINKYIKLHEKFGDAKHLFAGLGASMLMTLSAPRMEVVRSHILEMNEPVDQETVNALKKELLPAPQKKQKLNGGEWVASPGGGNRKYRIGGEIPAGETAQWLSQQVEASGGQMYAVISEFKETAHELQELKSAVGAMSGDNACFFSLPPEQEPILCASTSEEVKAIDATTFHSQTPNTKETTPEIDGWQVTLDNSNETLLFTSNQLAPLTLPDIKECEPMSLLEIEAAGGDVNEFVGMEVEVRTMSGKRKFGGVLIKFDEKNYFVKVATEEGERITDLRETWVF